MTRMVKQFISITFVTFMVSMSAMPLIQVHDCDKPCCESGENSCCTMDMSMEESCSMSFSECNNATLFIPILSAPVSQFENVTDFTTDEIVHIELEIDDQDKSTHVVEISHPPEPPPSFFTPLRI